MLFRALAVLRHAVVVKGVRVAATHFPVLVFVTMGLDLTFTMWPRLMTTYWRF